MSDLHELTATEQVAALQAHQISATDLTEHYLERIDRLGPELGAFVTVTPDLARREAEAADARLARGDSAPLLGLPLGIKDLSATAGVRTTFGSVPLSAHIPTEDAWTVGLLRRAGGVLVGKTNAAEFGATCYTENDVTEQGAVTPYDVTRSSSGSSGGAATAVAAGLLPVAHASDGAGSVRTPAATCHLVGVKPSRGLVSSAPSTTFVSAGTEGPIARTVQDAALLLDVMAQPSPGDLYGWTPTGSFVDAITRRPSRLRVAYWTETGVPGLDAHPEARAAVDRAVAALRDLGHDVQEIAIPVPADPAIVQAVGDLFAYSVGLLVSSTIPQDQWTLLRPYTQHLVERAGRMSGLDVVMTQTVLARYASSYLTGLDAFDVALTPTTNGPPVPLGHYALEGAAAEADRMLAWSCYTPWANLTGQPAVSLPSHLDAAGLPHAVQLVGRPRADADLLALCAELEAAGLWERVTPPCWER